MRSFKRGPPCPLRARVVGSNRHGAIGVRARSGQGGDPGPRRCRLDCVENTDIAGDQKADRLDRQSDPGDIGDDRDTLAARSLFEAEIEIIPARPRKPRAKLVIKPNLLAPAQCSGDRRHQDIAALGPGHPALDRDADERTREVNTTVRRDGSLRREFVESLTGENDDIVAGAGQMVLNNANQLSFRNADLSATLPDVPASGRRYSR